MRAGAWGVTVGLLLMLAHPAWATEAGGQSPDAFDQKMTRCPAFLAFKKLGRGVANVVGSPLEIPLALEQQYRRSNDAAAGLATGTIYGIFKAAIRLTVGGIETLTFFFPCPEHWAPILPPIGYFQKQPGAE